MAKAPLKDMPIERVRVEEFENHTYKIMDESILLFSRSEERRVGKECVP